MCLRWFMSRHTVQKTISKTCHGPRVHGFALFEGTGATHGHCPVETENLESVPRSKMTPSGIVVGTETGKELVQRGKTHSKTVFKYEDARAVGGVRSALCSLPNPRDTRLGLCSSR